MLLLAGLSERTCFMLNVFIFFLLFLSNFSLRIHLHNLVTVNFYDSTGLMIAFHKFDSEKMQIFDCVRIENEKKNNFYFDF